MTIFNAFLSLMVAIMPIQILLFAWQLDKRNTSQMTVGQAYLNAWKVIGSAIIWMSTFSTKK